MSARNGRHRPDRPLWGARRCPCGACDAERRAKRRQYTADHRARERAKGVRFVHGYPLAPGQTLAELRARRGE